MKKQPIIVIKLGTSSIVHENTHQPLLSTLALIVETAVDLRHDGYRVVIVSSGAIGLALQKTGQSRRPKHLAQVQALAAIGQCRLMGLWEEMFERMGQGIGQILLTRNDIADRTQYLNAKNTLDELLNMGFIPIVNENDTLAVSEIKFGDNDTLSAITAGMVGADYLFLMTDVDCLYDSNPRSNPDAKPIEVVKNILDLDVDVSSAGSGLGTGGMATKIIAARLATAAGVSTIITRSSRPGNIAAITSYLEAKKAKRKASANGHEAATDDAPAAAADEPPPLHTLFLPLHHRVRDRHFWLLHGLAPHGTLYVDHGAAKALSEGRGLLPVGVVGVTGNFAQQECVRVVEVSRAHHLPPTARTPLDGSLTSVAAELSASRPQTHRATSSISSLRGPPHGHLDVPSPGPTPANFTPSPSTLTPSPGSSQNLPSRNGPEKEIGRAIVNYSAIEISRIAGVRSTEIAHVLGYADTEYVAFRENLALFLEQKGSAGSLESMEAPGVGPVDSPEVSGTTTPVSGTLSSGRVGPGLGGYVEG